MQGLNSLCNLYLSSLLHAKKVMKFESSHFLVSYQNSYLQYFETPSNAGQSDGHDK